MYYIIYVNILLSIILISYINIIINIYIYIYDICNLETMCISSYHHNGFVATYSFGHPIHMM